jgi:uncharacterized protein
VKVNALALAVLLTLPGCSAQADSPAVPDEPASERLSLPDRPEGPVLDEADILSVENEMALNQRLRDYWNRKRTAVVVASVKSLGGASIDDYSRQLARKWDIGDRESLRGLLVLVAPNERTVRIEVSCGLTNVVTDEFASTVIGERMIPQFEKGLLAEGTIDGIDALIDRLDESSSPAPVSESCRALMRKAA